jgi:hypothetical protein
MQHFILNQYTSQDRNKLDKEIREWAEANINRILVDDRFSENFIITLKLKVDELNAKHKSVKKKLHLSVRSPINPDIMYITFSELLQYRSMKVKSKWIPF